MKKKELYIPVNVPDRNEVLPGFGAAELIACAVAFGIGVITAILIFVISQDILKALGTAIVILAAAVVLFRKNQYGENIIIKSKYVIAFHKTQKKYYYKYHNIYEGIGENERRTSDRANCK